MPKTLERFTNPKTLKPSLPYFFTPFLLVLQDKTQVMGRMVGTGKEWLEPLEPLEPEQTGLNRLSSLSRLNGKGNHSHEDGVKVSLSPAIRRAARAA